MTTTTQNIAADKNTAIVLQITNEDGNSSEQQLFVFKNMLGRYIAGTGKLGTELAKDERSTIEVCCDAKGPKMVIASASGNKAETFRFDKLEKAPQGFESMKYGGVNYDTMQNLANFVARRWSELHNHTPLHVRRANPLRVTVNGPYLSIALKGVPTHKVPLAVPEISAAGKIYKVAGMKGLANGANKKGTAARSTSASAGANARP